MDDRIVITGVGLTAPNGNNLDEFRQALLEGVSGIQHTDIRHMGKVAAGICNFDQTRHQSKKMRRRGTRAGAISVYCAGEAIEDSGINFESVDRSRVGIFIGITEHGNVETEEEIHIFYNQNNLDTKLWSHHHNPRTVANAPAGEVSLNLKITGPAYTIGAACAGGNMGLIQACHMLRLKEVDLALAGGVSESAATFGIFAAFDAQGALAGDDDPTKASRPMDKNRKGIVISEGGALFTLERLSDALARGAKIYGEIVGHHSNSDASDFVLPNKDRQVECMTSAIKKANLTPGEIDIVNMHATGTEAGDVQEAEAVNSIFGDHGDTYVNCTKGYIGHAMGAAGALELAGNLPGFEDGFIHPCKNIGEPDPQCKINNLVVGEKIPKDIKVILNNSFGMLGINSTVIVKKFEE